MKNIYTETAMPGIASDMAKRAPRKYIIMDVTNEQDLLQRLVKASAADKRELATYCKLFLDAGHPKSKAKVKK